jgi:hypothetical protein
VGALLAAACVPAAARAQTGGAAAPGAEPATIATASTGAFSLATPAEALLGKVTRFRGSVPAGEAGRTVSIERFEPLTAQWLPVAQATVAGDGTFVARWATDHIGQFQLRGRLDGDGAQAAAATPDLGVTVYKPAVATWYGPGFYGRRTACKLVMTHALLGVAHRRLPCGTPVALFYAGRTITVPVVDRGPFRNGADWDLTSATAQALGMTATSTVGALRLRPSPGS